MRQIQDCGNCELCKNQKPLLQTSSIRHNSTFFVGLSAVKVERIENEEPFSKSTRSGNLLREIADGSRDRGIYYTNMVKCLPLKGEKIRYPTANEMSACFSNFQLEMQTINPNKLVLFGKQVSEFVTEKLSIESESKYIEGGFALSVSKNYQILSAPHPSYMLVYRRKFLDGYMETIRRFIAGNANEL